MYKWRDIACFSIESLQENFSSSQIHLEIQDNLIKIPPGFFWGGGRGGT